MAISFPGLIKLNFAKIINAFKTKLAPLLPKQFQIPKSCCLDSKGTILGKNIPKRGLIHRLAFPCSRKRGKKSLTLSNSSIEKLGMTPNHSSYPFFLPSWPPDSSKTFRISPLRPPPLCSPLPNNSMHHNDPGARMRKCAFIIDVLIRNPHFGPWLAAPPQRAFRAAVTWTVPQ